MQHIPKSVVPPRKDIFVQFGTVSVRVSAILAVVGSSFDRSQIILAGTQHVVTVPKSPAIVIKAIEELS